MEQSPLNLVLYLVLLVFSSVIKILSTSEKEFFLLVRKRDRFLNKYFYWKTGRDKLGIRARLTVGSH